MPRFVVPLSVTITARTATYARQKVASSALRLLAIPGQIRLEVGEALPSCVHRPQRVVDRAAIRTIGRRLRQLRKQLTGSESVSRREVLAAAQLLHDVSTVLTKLLTTHGDPT